MRRFYGSGLPGVNPADLTGPFVVVEGQDGAGRSTHVRLLQDWLEEQGHAVTTVGLRRSALIARELSNAKQGHMLGRKTMSLFYATDLADQLEHQIIPALRAGNIVVADRYIYTLMARDMVRGTGPGMGRRDLRHGAHPGCGVLSPCDAAAVGAASTRQNGCAGLLGIGDGLGYSAPIFSIALSSTRPCSSEPIGNCGSSTRSRLSTATVSRGP